MNNDKKYLIKYLAVCIVSFLLCGGVSAYFLLSPEFESSNRKYAAIGIVLCLVAVLGGVLKYSDYYNKNIKPVKDPESLIDDRANAHRMYADKKLPGKDIYDVFRRYRRSFLWGRLMIIPVCLILIELLMVVKFQQVGWDIRWALVIGVAVVILALIIAGKKEMEFSTEEDLRKAIEKSKVDPVRLNADFMMSSCYKTSYGAIFIGRDYLVMFARKFCSVTYMKSIQSAQLTRKDHEVNGGQITHYGLKLGFTSGSTYDMHIGDEKKASVMLDELELRGVEVTRQS
ncbi:hypothetical protein SAMN05216413_1031 [Ruminococcaceae bacterium KH2T8]|nr:hypothetical protein SAMN05216413_1031 [Ruminococcaceae bacterium KH2T8]